MARIAELFSIYGLILSDTIIVLLHFILHTPAAAYPIQFVKNIPAQLNEAPPRGRTKYFHTTAGHPHVTVCVTGQYITAQSPEGFPVHPVRRVCSLTISESLPCGVYSILQKA